MNRKVKKVVGNFKQVYQNSLTHYATTLKGVQIQSYDDYIFNSSLKKAREKLEGDLGRTSFLMNIPGELEQFVKLWRESNNEKYPQGDLAGSAIGAQLWSVWNTKKIIQEKKERPDKKSLHWGYLNDKENPQPCGVCLTYDPSTGLWLLTLMQNANDPDPEKREVQLFYSDHAEFNDFSKPENTSSEFITNLYTSIEEKAGSTEVVALIKSLIKIDGTVDLSVLEICSNSLVSYQLDGSKENYFNKISNLNLFIDVSIKLSKENSKENLVKYIQNEINQSPKFNEKIETEDIEKLSQLIAENIFDKTEVLTNKQRLPIIKAILNFVAREFKSDKQEKVKYETIEKQLSEDIVEMVELLSIEQLSLDSFKTSKKNLLNYTRRLILELTTKKIELQKEKSSIVLINESSITIKSQWRNVQVITDVFADCMLSMPEEFLTHPSFKEETFKSRFVNQVLTYACKPFYWLDNIDEKNKTLIEFAVLTELVKKYFEKSSVYNKLIDSCNVSVVSEFAASYFLEKKKISSEENSVAAVVKDFEKYLTEEQTISKQELAQLIQSHINQTAEFRGKIESGNVEQLSDLIATKILDYTQSRKLVDLLQRCKEILKSGATEFANVDNYKNELESLNESIVKFLLPNIDLLALNKNDIIDDKKYSHDQLLQNFLAANDSSYYFPQGIHTFTLSGQEVKIVLSKSLLKVVGETKNDTKWEVFDNGKSIFNPIDSHSSIYISEGFLKIENEKLRFTEEQSKRVIKFEEIRNGENLDNEGLASKIENTINDRSKIYEKVKELPLGFVQQSYQLVRSVSDNSVFEGRIFSVMNFIEGKTLRNVLDDISNNPSSWSHGQRTTLAINLLLVLKNLHDKGVIHRDIKPENIIVGDNLKVTFVDFDNATDNTVAISEPAVSLGYSPPEILDNKSNISVDEKSDLFSMGRVIGEIYGADFPEISKNAISTEFKIEETVKYNFPNIFKGIPPESSHGMIRYLLKNINHKDKSSRPTVDQTWAIMSDIKENKIKAQVSVALKSIEHHLTVQYVNDLSAKISDGIYRFAPFLMLNNETEKFICLLLSDFIKDLTNASAFEKKAHIMSELPDKILALIKQKILEHYPAELLIYLQRHNKSQESQNYLALDMKIVSENRAGEKEIDEDKTGIFTKLFIIRSGMMPAITNDDNKLISKEKSNRRTILDLFNKIYDALESNKGYKAVLALVQLDEFVKTNQLEQNEFTDLLSKLELPNLTTLKSISKSVAELNDNTDERIRATIVSITNGIALFDRLISGFPSKPSKIGILGINDVTEDKVLSEFIAMDLAPNTEVRKQIESSIRGVHVTAFETLVPEQKETANNYVYNVSEKCDEYFSDPNKNKKTSGNASKKVVFFNQLCEATEQTAVKLSSRFRNALQKILLCLTSLFTKKSETDVVKKPDAIHKPSVNHVWDIQATLYHHKKDRLYASLRGMVKYSTQGLCRKVLCRY